MSGECDHNAIHCDCGHQQDIEEAVSAERKRIIALARAKAEAAPYASERDFYLEFANELEAECE